MFPAPNYPFIAFSLESLGPHYLEIQITLVLMRFWR